MLKLLCNFHVNDINNKDFTVACAAGANRPVRAKCLVKGIRAPIEEAWLTILVHKLDGDVGQYLLQCVAAESFDVADEAYILYAIVLWAKKSGGRYALPPQVLQRGRALLRKDLDRQALAALMAVALDAADESFLELVSKADSRKAQTAMEQEQQGFSRLGEDRLRPRDSWSSSTRHGISPDTPETAKTLRTFFGNAFFLTFGAIATDLFRSAKIFPDVRISLQIFEDLSGCSKISTDLRRSSRMFKHLYRSSKIREDV